MSEDKAKSLLNELVEFEDQWKRAKLSVRAQVKKGVLDAEVPEDLRITRAVWYKQAKRDLKHALSVAQFKLQIIKTLGERAQPMGLLQSYSGLATAPAIKLQPFVEALHELEAEAKVEITREGGTAHSVARDIAREAFSIAFPTSMIERTKFTEDIPSHGFGGAVCTGCIVKLLLAESDISRES